MNEIDQLSSEIMSIHSRKANEEMTHPDYLPDKEEVVTVTTLLRQLLFPGYFDENVRNNTDHLCMFSSLLKEIENKLQPQICRALNLESGDGSDCSDKYENAGELCLCFLKRIPDILLALHTDVQATYDGDPAAHSKHEIIFAYPGIVAISIYRLAHELYLLKVPFIPRMMTEYAHSLTGIDIHPGAEIGHHFFIDHGTGIVIGETTKIGAHVKLYQGVTLGALSTRGGQSLRGKKRHPTLEDEVTVYSNASILGGDTVVGRGCVIGGNVFITQSIPPDTRVNLRREEPDYDTISRN